MRKRRTVKWFLAFAVFLICGLAVQFCFSGYVHAYCSQQHSRDNLIKIGDITTGIEEQFDPPDVIRPGEKYDKTVTVRNESSTPCFVRVFIAKDQENLPVSIQFDTKYWTEKQEDGYYYYRTVLEGKEKTKPLFTSVETGKEGSPFRIIVYEESVQAEGYLTAGEAFASITGKQEVGV